MSLSKDFVTELIIMIIIVIACIVGPIALIGAQFSVFFIVSGIVFTIYCILISKLITKGSLLLFAIFKNRLNLFWTGMILGFIPFIGFTIFLNREEISGLLKFSRQQALFNFPIIMGICLLFMLLIVFRGSSIKSAVYKIGVGFLFPIVVTIFLIPFVPNSEGKVILGNVVVIYFTCKTAFNHFIGLLFKTKTNGK